MHPQASSDAKAAYYLGLIGLIAGWCTLFIPNFIAMYFGHTALKTAKFGQPGYREARKGLTMAYLPLIMAILGFTLAMLRN